MKIATVDVIFGDAFSERGLIAGQVENIDATSAATRKRTHAATHVERPLTGQDAPAQPDCVAVVRVVHSGREKQLESPSKGMQLLSCAFYLW